MILKFIEKILYIFYPDKCVVCNKIIDKNCYTGICIECLDKFRIFNYEICKKNFDENNGFSMFLYTSEIKKIIHNFKYEDYGYYARAMGIKMAEFFQNLNLVYIDGIISVPIHWKRERERGFNQVDIIANEISKICKIPLIKNVLIRTKNTKPQFNLNKTKRIENINGAFDIIDKTKILGKNILLIDDIYTTGTTLKECIKILKENGAENVYYFTLASTKTFVK